MNRRVVKRVVLTAAVVAAMLTVAGSAAAKGGESLQLCGSSGCAALGEAFPLPTVPAAPTAPPAAVGPYYALTFGDVAGSALAYWIPGARLVRMVDQSGIAQWLRVPADVMERLDALTTLVRPLPPPAVFEVIVNHHSVPHGAGYGRLFTVGTPVQTWPRSIVWVPVKVFTTPGGPWGDGANSLWISTRGGYLMRDRHVVRISPVLARRVLARRRLTS